MCTQNPENWRSKSTEDKEKQINLAHAHSKAFAEVQDVIDRDIIRSRQMLKLSKLCNTY